MQQDVIMQQENIPAIQFHNVTYAYSDDGTPALNGVSFTVNKGEFVSVLGHNGSGKSTLAKLCNGLLESTKGTVSIFGQTLEDAKSIRQARKRVGVVFQNPDNQTVASIVEDDVAFGPENLGVPREEIGARITWALDAVGMSAYRQATPSRLSGGQKQRLAVAGVLAIKPDVLILDESTAMLDPKGRREVMEVVQKLNKEEGITVLFITHFMEEALLADRTVVMNRGEIVMQGTPQEIFQNGEMLQTYNLRLPTLTYVANRLRNSGFFVPATLSVEEFASAIALQLKEENDARQPTQNILESGGEWDIKISDLRYVYSPKSPFATQALNDVNLTVPQGEFFGVLGHTGSGKSTLVQHLNALIKLPQAQKGYRPKRIKKGQTPPVMPQIQVGEFRLSDKKCPFQALRSQVGMVFQYPEHQLFAETVFADVAFGLKNFNQSLSTEQTTQAVKQAIEAVGLNFDEIKDKSPFDLSGGQKRRVAIAGVIVTRPKILILDEPAAGLDPLGKQEIMQLLHKLHAEWCKTVIIVSHDMDEIAEHCTGAAVLAQGEVKYCLPPSRLFLLKDELFALGLDIPLSAKIVNALRERGADITCDFTIEGLICAIERRFKGVSHVE